MVSVSISILSAEAQLVDINYMHTLYVPGHHAGLDMAGAGTHIVNMIEGTAFFLFFSLSAGLETLHTDSDGGNTKPKEERIMKKEIKFMTEI